MVIDWSQLTIDKLVVHQLPDPPQDGILSDRESPLPTEVQNFFCERLGTALKEHGHPISFVPEINSPVRSATERAILLDQSAFIEDSQKIARHLFSIHNLVHSPGLLCCLLCRIGDRPGYAIAKLEQEQGVRAELRGSAGNQHFEIKVIPDLLLTEKTRVFKAAMWLAMPKAQVLEALVCDDQRPRTKLIAQYFLSDFLGCQLSDRPDVSTQKFMNLTEKFINTRVEDPERRASYQAALLVEINSKSKHISPRQFAQKHLEAADEKPYLQHMTENKLLGEFPKDVSLVKERLRRVTIEFDGNVVLYVPPALIGTSVVIEKIGNKDRAVVTGKIVRMRGKK